MKTGLKLNMNSEHECCLLLFHTDVSGWYLHLLIPCICISFVLSEIVFCLLSFLKYNWKHFPLHENSFSLWIFLPKRRLITFYIYNILFLQHVFLFSNASVPKFGYLSSYCFLLHLIFLSKVSLKSFSNYK